MKKYYTFFCVASMMMCTGLKAQNCATGVFYGLGNDALVHKYTISGNTITHNGTASVAQDFAPSLGLAIANFGTGNAFYSTRFNQSNSQYDLLKYVAGSGWTLAYSDSSVRLNAAGKGNYLYLQNQYSAIGPQYVNRIQRFDGTAVATIWTDNFVFQAVGDIAADDAGNVYYFTGDASGNAQFLNVMSSSGDQLNAYPIAFVGTGAFGTFISGNTIYVGFALQSAAYPNKLLPITISDGNAVIGTPLTIPTVTIGSGPNGPINLYLTDLDSCAAATLGVDSIFEDHFRVYPNPVSEMLQFNTGQLDSGLLTVYDATGKVLKSGKYEIGENEIDASSWANGMYFLKLDNGTNLITRKIIKE